MNENTSVFRAGWQAIAENTSRPRLKSVALSDATRTAYRVEKARIRALSYTSVGYSFTKEVTESLPTQLNLFDDYVQKQDCR